MPELEFDPVDDIAAGAVGVPGQRAFYIQATKDGQTVAVLVEKEQVAILSARIETLLDEVATQFPEVESEVVGTDVVGDPVPLFRALAIGIGFDPIRQMILLELHERPLDESDEDDEVGEEGPSPVPAEDVPAEEGEGWLARLYLSAGQARAMARHGSAAVLAGRPPCPLCGNPLDAGGHVCPKLNGHAH
jgi:uncharacterized repeat protein (TIGR03847 family)